MTSPNEPLVQIQNNLTELILKNKNALFQNYTIGSTPSNKGVARALDEKCL